MKGWATPTGGELRLEIVRQDEGAIPSGDRLRVLVLPQRPPLPLAVRPLAPVCRLRDSLQAFALAFRAAFPPRQERRLLLYKGFLTS